MKTKKGQKKKVEILARCKVRILKVSRPMGKP